MVLDGEASGRDAPAAMAGPAGPAQDLPSDVTQGALVQFSSDGKLLAVAFPNASDAAVVLDTATRQVVATIPASAARPARSVVGVAFSPDGETLSVLTAVAGTVSDSITVQRWPLTGGTVRPLSAGLQVHAPASSEGPVASLSSDGSTLIAAEKTGLERWNLTATQPAGTLFGPADATAVQLSANGAYVAATVGNHTQVWNVATKSPYGQRIPTDGNTWELSPDGTTLAVADQLIAVELWNTATGEPLGANLASGEATILMAFSADGNILATTGAAGVQLWDIATSLPIGGVLPTADTPTSVALDPTGTGLATASNFPVGATASAEPVEGPAQLWEVSPLTPAQAAQAVCAQTGQTLSQPQWNGYETGTPYIDVCPSNPAE